MKTSAGCAGSAHLHVVCRGLLAAACFFAAAAILCAGAAAAHDRTGERFPAAVAAAPEIPSIHARGGFPSLAKRPDYRRVDVGESGKFFIEFRRSPRRLEQREAWPADSFESATFAPDDAVELVAPSDTLVMPAFGDVCRHQSRTPPQTAEFLEIL